MLITKQCVFYFFLANVLILSACKSDEPIEQPAPQRTFVDVERDFSEIDISPGIRDIELEILNGTIYNFRVIAPERNVGEDRPFILALHGASNSPDAHKNTSCYVEKGLDTLNAFILSPNGEGGLWFTDFSQEMLGNLVFLARKYWSIDETKIAVTGYSNGGNGSWLLGKTQPGTISAAIPMASSYDVYEQDSTVSVWNIPMYVIHGENDELFPLEITQGWVEATSDAGTDVTFVVAPGLGHYEPCEYAPYLKEAAIWLKETVWME